MEETANVSEQSNSMLDSRLVSEWDYSRNYPDRPEDFTPGSGVLTWWKCPEGHRWLTRIEKRVQGENCPVCYGRTRYVLRFV